MDMENILQVTMSPMAEVYTRAVGYEKQKGDIQKLSLIIQ